MKRNNNKGFTLAELLIVVAVIAVLVAVAIPTFGSQLEKSRQAVDVANLRDAYAAAKLMLLSVDDTGNALGTQRDTSGTATKFYRFWYKDEALQAVAATEETVTKDKAVLGKATTATLINKSDLHSSMTYTATTLAALTGVAPGTVEKGIVVEFVYNPYSNSFGLSNITFANKAVLEGDTPIATGSGEDTTISAVAVKTEPKNEYTPTDNLFNVDGLVITVTDGDGSKDIAYSENTAPLFIFKNGSNVIAVNDTITAAGTITVEYAGATATYTITYTT